MCATNIHSGSITHIHWFKTPLPQASEHHSHYFNAVLEHSNVGIVAEYYTCLTPPQPATRNASTPPETQSEVQRSVAAHDELLQHVDLCVGQVNF